MDYKCILILMIVTCNGKQTNNSVFFCNLKCLSLQGQELFYNLTLMRTDACLDSITKFSINTPVLNGFRSPELCEWHSRALSFPMFSRLAGMHPHPKQQGDAKQVALHFVPLPANAGTSKETKVQLESTGFGFPMHVLSDVSWELGIAFVGWDRAIPSN